MKLNSANIFKKLSATFGILALFQCAQAQFTFPVYEPFSEYPEGDRIGKLDPSSGVNWTTGNSLSATSSPQVSSTNAQSYPGLLPDPNAPAKGINGQIGTSGRTAAAPFTAQTTNIYSSFILNLQSYPTGLRPFFGLNGTGGSTPSPSSGIAVWLTPSGQLQISKNNATTPATNTTAPLTLGSTYFVVIAYKFQAGPDEVDLWLNPTSLGNNANIPPPTISSTNNNDSASIGFLGLYYPSANLFPFTNMLDEIRVDTNWAGVTPLGPSPGPTFGVTITGSGSGCPGDAFPIGLTGSVTTNVYLLYTNSAYSGNVVSGSGSAITFGPQSTSAIYTVLASNINTTAVAWMSNSVAISVLTPPSIVTQPNSVTVATNSVAVFNVVASGTGLNYQWFKNGSGLTDGGHISGATTPNLVISPATTADQATTANGYYVLITNRCGFSAGSLTNALVLDAPGNVVWQGGNPNTNWDTATTPNWTNSAGSPAVFNAGDKVTFDDSSTNLNVILAGSYLAPSQITELAGQNYSFSGSGSIVGPGTLIMAGSGVLTISNANSFTGGTIISNNGTIAVKDANQMALGFGPVNLAGGTLWVPLKSTAANIGITNNINVTADSRIQFDGAGSFGLDLFGALSRSSGATLLIYHVLNNSATPDRIRLYGNFTNDLPINILSTGNTVEFSPYNPSANQMYNGVISGFSGRIAPHGSGNVIFNGANTINDSGVNNNGNGPSGYSLFYGGGNVGIGADSVSASPPTIDSSPVGTGNIGIDVTAGNDSMFASGGAHTIANPLLYTSATNTVTFTISGSNNLTLSGPIVLSGVDGTGNTNRTFAVNNTFLTTFSGVISDAVLACGLTKTGAGTLVLSGVDTYTGPTLVGAGALWVNGQIDVGTVTVTNGSLGGTGIALGAVTVTAPGAIAPGTTSIGTLTINNNLTLAGNGLFKVNKSLSPAQSNDIATVSGTLSASGTGTVTVSNLGPALVVGDSFKLFSAAVPGGNTLAIAGAGVTWTNKLALDGSIQVLSLGGGIANYPTNITFSLSGSTLNVGWPATHLGWILQEQTNSLSVGLTLATNTWSDIAGTSAGTNATATINPTNPAVFFRLRHP